MLLNTFKMHFYPWPLWLSWLGVVLQSEVSPLQFLMRAHAWFAGLDPSQGVYKRQPINASLSDWCFSPSSPTCPLSLKINKKFNVFIKHINVALSGTALWIECQPVNQRVTGSIPSQSTCLGCRPGPQFGSVPEATDRCFSLIVFSHIGVSLSLCLPPFPSL